MESKSDPERIASEEESLSASVSDLGTRVKKRSMECRLRVVTAAFCFVTVITVAAFALEFRNRRHQCHVTQSKLHGNQSEYQSLPRKMQEHIEVVGDGSSYLVLKKGSKLFMWKTLEIEGQLYLRSRTFIVMRIPGVYRVYAQYTVYNPDGSESGSQSVSVMLMKNRSVQCTSIVEKCNTVCTRTLLKTIKVKKDDHLSIQTGTGGTFLLNSKYAYFGVVKMG